MAEDYLNKLAAALAGITKMLILPHNDPDPDAIAAAVGLQHLLAERFQVESNIAYRGYIGRAENRALVRYLDNPLTQMHRIDLGETTAFALVDTQPGTGNNPLPDNNRAVIVIDHHAAASAEGVGLYRDVRPEIGSTSTIITEYLLAAEIEPSKELATALFYGIKTDTKGLSRNTHQSDISAYFYLQPKIDVSALAKIEQAQVPLDYFRSFDNAVHASKIYGNDIIITYLGKLAYPDQCAEIADFLMRLQGINWVFCMGVFRREFILSVRTINKSGGAGKLVMKVIQNKGTAGGHGLMGAGHIELKRSDDPEQIANQLTRDALLYLRGSEDIPHHPMM